MYLCIFKTEQYFLSTNSGREDGDFFFADVPATQIPVIAQAVISFTAMGDSVAQEGNETFQIRIPAISPPLTAGNFLRDTVTVTITDDNCE